MRLAALLPLLLVTACSQEAGSDAAPGSGYLPPMGSNEVYRGEPGAAPGRQLIVADLHLGPDAVGAAHSHPWEEHLYVLGGSAVVDIEGMNADTLEAGEFFVIPPGTVHTPRAGPDGVRAIIMRLHNEGEPDMVPAGQ